MKKVSDAKKNSNKIFAHNIKLAKLNLLLYKPYYAEARNELAVPISAS